LALLLISLLTLGLTTLLSTLMDLKIYRDNNVRDIQVLAGVVGDNCIAALVFDSPETASRHLATLEREYQVRHANLYDASGAVFARWERAGQALPAEADRLWDSTLGQISILQTHVIASHTIRFEGRPIGDIVLHARLDEMKNELRLNAILGLAITLVTFAVALVVALRLQRRIAQPILDLAATSRAISQQQDFSARVVDPNAGEEIGTLVQDFNALLKAIEQRETSLQRQSEALRQVNAKLRRLAVDVSVLEQTERARLATELHDSPMQKLALAQMQIAAAGPETDDESTQLRNTGLELLREAIAELRTLQFDLSPPVLAQRGLPGALPWLAESTQSQWGIEMHCEIDGTLPELSRELSVILYQCARELVYNMVKHAHARRGAIRLGCHEGMLLLEVEDDGIGLARAPLADADAAPATALHSEAGSGFGLYSVRERLALLQGSLSVQVLTPGARIRIRLPVCCDNSCSE
jgi:signal transduction histidine kinase